MALIDCALTSILDPSGCNDRGGISSAYWFEYNTVDWDDMVGDPLKFDTTNHIILDYTMIGGALLYPVEFTRKSAFYDFTYTRDTDVYTLLVQWIHKGKSSARRLALQNAIACCNLGLHLYMNDGTQRVVGPDYNGVVIKKMLEPLALTRNLDSSGQLGTSRSRDEVDLGGEAFYAPLFATVAEGSLPLT